MAKVERKCSLAFCDNTHRADGLCMAHYQRNKKGLSIDSPITVTRPKEHAGCMEDSCSNNHYSKGYCRFHYQRTMVNKPFDHPYAVQTRTVEGVDTHCSFESCNRDLYDEEYCRGHYMQKWLGLGLKTLPKHARIGGGDENGVVCTQCFTYKTNENFYKRVTGGFQSRCKECMCAKAALAQWNRRGGQYPEWASAYCERLEKLHAESHKP